MSEVVAPSPTAASPAKVQMAKRHRRSGPTVSELIVAAVSESRERKGMSLVALKKALAAGGYDVDRNKARVRIAVKSLVRKGWLLQTRGHGASGSFRLDRKALAKRSRPARRRRRKRATKVKKAAGGRRRRRRMRRAVVAKKRRRRAASGPAKRRRTRRRRRAASGPAKRKTVRRTRRAAAPKKRRSTVARRSVRRRRR